MRIQIISSLSIAIHIVTELKKKFPQAEARIYDPENDYRVVKIEESDDINKVRKIALTSQISPIAPLVAKSFQKCEVYIHKEVHPKKVYGFKEIQNITFHKKHCKQLKKRR